MFVRILTSLVLCLSVAAAAGVAASESGLPNETDAPAIETDPPAISFVSYKDAYQRAAQERVPLVVFVGAKWCPACRKMEESVIPNLPKNPILQKAVFARLDYDQDTKLAQAVTGGGALPQVVIFPPQGSSGKLRRAVGAQSVEKLFQFLRDGLTAKGAPAESAAMNGVPNRSS